MSQFQWVPKVSEIPTEFALKKIVARTLVGGKIESNGFATQKVWAATPVLDANNQVVNVELGETPWISAPQFLAALDSNVEAWNRGKGQWAIARMEERIHAVSLFRDKMKAQRDLISKLLMWEIGKTWTDACMEFDRTIAYIDDTIEAVKQMDRDSSRIQFAGGIMAQIRRAPLGVVLCMGPFNYPLNETFTTLIPALILGNCILVKLPRFGQLIWDPLLEAFRDCFPAGVVNVVNGDGKDIVGPAVRTGKIDVLAFIGSSQVANQIKMSHPQPHRFRSVLGLDAKNPAYVMSDADLDLAVSEVVKGALSFNGQRCTAIKMVFVERKIEKEFCQKLAAAVDNLVVGAPWTPGVSITALPDPKKTVQLEAYVKDALAGGAVLLNPGRGAKVEGRIFAPAVLGGTSLQSKVVLEEQFGPIVPVTVIDQDQEFEDYVVASPYGMQVSLFGSDPARVGSLIDGLINQVCRMNLNAQCQRGPDVFPFTGRKGSAEGTLSVTDALRQFSIRTMIAVKQDQAGKKLVKNIMDGDHSQFLSSNIVL